MKFERSEIGALFSKLRTAVPEVRAVGNDSTGILLSGPDAFATNLELSIRAELSSPVPQDVVIPPRGVDFISGAVSPRNQHQRDKERAGHRVRHGAGAVEHDAGRELSHI